MVTNVQEFIIVFNVTQKFNLSLVRSRDPVKISFLQMGVWMSKTPQYLLYDTLCNGSVVFQIADFIPCLYDYLSGMYMGSNLTQNFLHLNHCVSSSLKLRYLSCLK